TRAALPLHVTRHVRPLRQAQPLRFDRLPDVDIRVADDQGVGATGPPTHRVGDPRLFRTRHEMVDENAEPATRAGPELCHDADQVVDPAEVLDNDAFDAQVLAPDLCDEFGVMSALDVDAAGTGDPGAGARQRDRTGGRSAGGDARRATWHREN